MAKIELGDKVKDTVSGFTGTAVAITKWMNGCTRITVSANTLKDGKPIDDQWFDEQQVEIIKPKNKKKSKSTGGGSQEFKTQNAF